MVPGYIITEGQVINHHRILKSPRSVMVCMPFAYDEFQAALLIFDSMVERFSGSELTVVALWNFRNWIENRAHWRMVSLTSYSANFFRLPTRQLRASLRLESFDVAIDLNPGGILFSSILCAACGAKVRVGFAGEKSDCFFNFQVQPRADENIRDKYVTLLNYLN